MAKLLVAVVGLGACHSGLATPYTITDASELQQKWWDWGQAQSHWDAFSSAATKVVNNAGDSIQDAHGAVTSHDYGQYWGHVTNALDDITSNLDHWKNKALEGLSGTGKHLCDKMRSAAGQATPKIEEDIKQQHLEPIDFSGQAEGTSTNPCLKQVADDVHTEMNKILGMMGVADEQAVKDGLAYISEKGASGACSTKSALDHISLDSALDAICPPQTSRLFTVFGHPLVKDGSPTAALAAPLLVIFSASLGAVYVRHLRSSARTMSQQPDMEAGIE